MPRLPLLLARVESVRGVYGRNDDWLPARMRWLHPDAAASFAEISASVVVSDMFRSAEASLRAIRTKAGSARPGYSGHNYGLSIDLDVRRTLKSLGMRRKMDLDEWMQDRGWYCHRRDHRRALEDWHYNYGIAHLIHVADRRTSPALNRRILELYGDYLELNSYEVQRHLAGLMLYHGAIDGIHGPITQEAVRAFQRAWGLAEDGIAGRVTQRTLAYVTSYRVSHPTQP